MAETNSLPTNLKGSIDIAIIAIREDEYTAILKRLRHKELYKGEHRTYLIARIPFDDGTEYLLACASSIEQGGSHAQDLTRDMIEDLDPHLIMAIGIAGAIPHHEFTLGDVVVAKRLHDFSVGAALENRDLQAANQGGPMHKGIQDIL